MRPANKADGEPISHHAASQFLGVGRLGLPAKAVLDNSSRTASIERSGDTNKARRETYSQRSSRLMLFVIP